jgi:hypothetical protein
MGTQYKCFQFNEEALFEKPIGSAYQLNLDNDQKINNGLNSKDSNILRIKVRKIKAVKKLNDKVYSTESYYWFNDDTGIVYDYELNYPIGKVLKDDNNNYHVLEGTIYIIDDIIEIPLFKLYE